jgi:endonuclease III
MRPRPLSPKPPAVNVRTVARRLAKAYPDHDLGNQQDPLDELIFIIISTMTTGPSFRRTFAQLKRAFPSWDSALRAGVRGVEKVIRPAGLSRIKSRLIIRILQQLKRRLGRVNLSALAGLPTSEAEEFLISLPGVGLKTARCVLMYSLDRDVFPVDTHCLRISRRLGWTQGTQLSERVADEVQEIIPPDVRHALHVGMVMHGRAVCRAKAPNCASCVVKAYCQREGVAYSKA